MAEAFFNRFAAVKAIAESAGTHPASHVDRNVAQAMQEIGIDISGRRPKMLTPDMLTAADKIVTMGCDANRVCPTKFKQTDDWGIEDPEGKPIEKIREIRNEVEIKVKQLLQQIESEKEGT
jgi:protein-tyrosine-phosphatase